MPIPQYWETASPAYKQKLRDWLGEMAFNEFLSHIRPDLSLDVISDWWDWSLREGRKGIQHIFQELDYGNTKKNVLKILNYRMSKQVKH